MSVDNLAIVIAPNILRPKEESVLCPLTSEMSSVMSDTPLVHSVFSSMIKNAKALLSGLDVPTVHSP